MNRRMIISLAAFVMSIFATQLLVAQTGNPPTTMKPLHPSQQPNAPVETKTASGRVVARQPVVHHIVNAQGNVSFYRVTCDGAQGYCSCTSPSDVLISGGGRCLERMAISDSYPDPDPAKNTWWLLCSYVTWRGTQREIANPALFYGVTTPKDISIICAKTQ